DRALRLTEYFQGNPAFFPLESAVEVPHDLAAHGEDYAQSISGADARRVDPQVIRSDRCLSGEDPAAHMHNVDILPRIRPLHLTGEVTAVGKEHANFLRPRHDVMVRENVSVFVDNDARADALLLNRHSAEQRIDEDPLRGVDLDHRFPYGLHRSDCDR